MKRWLLPMTFALCLVACTRPAGVQSTPTPTASQPGSTHVTANGVLRPAGQVTLSFGVASFVRSVEAEMGERVEANQALARLDDAALERAVTEAEIELEGAMARLVQLQMQATPVPERMLAATTAVTSAQAALTQARVQASQRENQDIIDRYELEQAQRALEDAQREYEKVLNNPQTHTWAPSSPQARALEETRDYHDVVLARYSIHAADRDYAVAIAEAETRLAEARLKLYEARHPVAPKELDLARVEVERAQSALEAMEADLARTTLSAPFDGIVSAVLVNVGEWASPGAPVVELLDVSRWRVETRNVGELEIARVRVGQTAMVEVNAFRQETLSGRVIAIAPVAVVQQGDTTYTLTIEMEPTDLNLRPGMTAQVEILSD